MEKYKPILNKKINLEFDGKILNSYKITEMKPTEKFLVGLEGSGKVYECSVDWQDKKSVGAYSVMGFDEQTLNGLLEEGLAVCPTMPNLVYRIDGKKFQKDLWSKNK